MRVGFPWISLDSLVRIETYQWVTRDFRRKKNLAPFSLALRGAGTGACGRGHAEAQDCSWGKLKLVSDFLQEILVRAALSAASIQNSSL
jgi:hypothetical protein